LLFVVVSDESFNVNVPLFVINGVLFCNILYPFKSNIISLSSGTVIVLVLDIVVNSLNSFIVSPVFVTASIASCIVLYFSLVDSICTTACFARYFTSFPSIVSFIMSYPSSISVTGPLIAVDPVIFPS